MMPDVTKSGKEMIAKESILKEVGQLENYTLKITGKIAAPEEFERWGLCDKCERRLTGRSSTPKPQDLICLGCVQAEKRSVPDE